MACAGCEKTNEKADEGKDNEYKPLELSTKSVEILDKSSTFTFGFIKKINDAEDKDYIISPLSMQFLLGMILNGAQGDTAAEICNVLGFGAGETAAVNEYALSLLQQLPEMDKKTKLCIADAIFVNQGWPLKDTYKAAVGKYYLSEVTNLDFSNGDAALKTINGWCNDHTNGLIPEVLEEVSDEMLAYLLNAVYFKSQWKNKFPKENTINQDFTDEAGLKSKVKMMMNEGRYHYTENEVFQAVCMPYGNGAFSMTVLLPKSGYKVADVANYLAGCTFSDLGSMTIADVFVQMPKFETKYNKKLNDILSEMGMPLSFDEKKADFKAMAQTAAYLSFVQQHAYIKVDEEGTEAAAVSIAGMFNATSLPSPGKSFIADHPFLYLITEASTGAVLFAGRYSGK